MSNSLINEDELPTGLSDYEYAQWFKYSFISGGVGCRVGPRLVKRRIEEGRPDYDWAVEPLAARFERATQLVLRTRSA